MNNYQKFLINIIVGSFWGLISNVVIILFGPLLYSMGIRCSGREALVSMERVVSMVVYIITGITAIGLLACLVWSIYMAIWGVYDEFY